MLLILVPASHFRGRLEPGPGNEGAWISFLVIEQPTRLIHTLDASLRRRSEANMKVVRRLRFLSQDRGLYRPLVLGAPSDSYSTMSHPGATTGPLAPEPVFPGVRKVATDVPVVSPQSYDEPIVSRKELWAYYCKCLSSSLYPGSLFVTTCIPSILQWRQRGLILLLIVKVVENTMRGCYLGSWS